MKNGLNKINSMTNCFCSNETSETGTNKRKRMVLLQKTKTPELLSK